MKTIASLAFTLFLFNAIVRGADATGPIEITTAHSALTLGVGVDGRLYEYDFGSREHPTALTNKFQREVEFYPQYGDGFILEPALQATHADGNTSTDLIYSRHATTTVD